MLNTDAETYAGSGAGNYGSVATEDIASHGFAQSAAVTVPPLAAVWFKYEG